MKVSKLIKWRKKILYIQTVPRYNFKTYCIQKQIENCINVPLKASILKSGPKKVEPTSLADLGVALRVASGVGSSSAGTKNQFRIS